MKRILNRLRQERRFSVHRCVQSGENIGTESRLRIRENRLRTQFRRGLLIQSGAHGGRTEINYKAEFFA